MCYLIHIGVPTWYEPSVEAPRDFHVGRHHNPSIDAAFGSAFAAFTVSDGGCSCAMYVPPRNQGTEDRRTERKRKKYSRLGWSESKVQRATTAAAGALEHSSQLRRSGLRKDVAQYVAELTDVALEVKLVVHEYRGLFASEHVPSSAPKRITTNDLREGVALSVDTVYTIDS